MEEDLFKNPFRTYLIENDNPYNLPQLPDGTYVAPEVFKQGAIRKHYPGQKVLFHTIIHNRLQQQRRAEAMQMHEAWIKDGRGRSVDTDRGGYYHPDTNEWIPPKPISRNGWTRHDIGIRPPRSPINKSKFIPAKIVLDPINKAAHDAKQAEAQKRAEDKERARQEREQRAVWRELRIQKMQDEIQNPKTPKPRGRPPKKRDGWF